MTKSTKRATTAAPITNGINVGVSLLFSESDNGGIVSGLGRECGKSVFLRGIMVGYGTGGSERGTPEGGTVFEVSAWGASLRR